jgi:hypothetical protein
VRRENDNPGNQDPRTSSGTGALRQGVLATAQSSKAGSAIRPITDEGVTVGGALASDTAVGMMRDCALTPVC